jgi:hypothetical protein
MSLILDALRKLEREKGTEDPAVLVVGSVPWGQTSRTRRLVLAVGGAAVVALAVLVGWLLRAAPSPPTAAVQPPLVASPSAPAPARMVPAPLPTAAATAPSPLPRSLAAAPPIRLSGRAPSTAGADSAATSARAGPADAPTPDAARPDDSAVPPAVESPAEAAESPAEIAESPAETASPAPSAGGSAELRLNAISTRDGRPIALINDRLVFEGDSFDGVRVLRIGETEVELDVRGQRRVLRF